MPKSIRVLTTPGEKSINVNIEQDFEYLEILSLKLLQSDIYTRQCSDYGVVVGRVSVNGGFGIPNARISVFIPLDGIDEQDPVISEIYPYKTVTDRNDEGYRYNLLPYNAQHINHVPTGTFFNRNDVLLEPNLIYVYDKYYKFTTTTNNSGDFMLFGVPTGNQTLFVDLDLSDIGEFSLSPKDLIRMGRATEDQVNKTKFKASNNIDSLPQIVSIIRNIEVDPLWGQPDICSLGITRTDFDVSKEAGIQLRPTAIFMGSIFTNNDVDSIEQYCSVSKEIGELCKLETNSGTIRTIRQTIFTDSNGRPGLESFTLENGGQVIDENGVWLVEIPMNLDYVTTDEFGNRVISLDPQVGIPTKGKYRFKIKWNQTPGLDSLVKRANFLVPNIREYWSSESGKGFKFGGAIPPSLTDVNFKIFRASYAFTTNWDDYGYTGTTTSDPEYPIGLGYINDAINCVDKFYEFSFNKVYTVSQLHTQYRRGFSRHRYLGIKNILNPECDSDNHKFPSNDAIMNVNFLLMLFNILMILMVPIIYAIVILLHIVSFIVNVLIYPILVYLLYQVGKSAVAEFANAIAASTNIVPQIALTVTHTAFGVLYVAAGVTLLYIFTQVPKIQAYFKNFKIPNYTYPNCDMCTCKPTDNQDTKPLDNTATKKPSDGGGDTNNIPASPDGSNYLSQISNASLYSTSPKNVAAIGGLKSGVGIPFEGTIGTGVGTTGACIKVQSIVTDCDGPALPEYIESYRNEESGTDESKGTAVFTSMLPLPEMVNLFNLKDKYFSTTVPNTNFNSGIVNNIGGKGVNQIKVTFNVDKNDPNNFYHLDNVVAILVGENQGSSLTQGKIITFQNLDLTKDSNFTSFPENEYGTPAITGTSYFVDKNTPKQITVKYADPKSPNNELSTTYFVVGNPEDAAYLRFPIDIEYYQVIYSKPYSKYKAEVGNTLQASFHNRYLANTDNYYFTSYKYPYSKPWVEQGDCNKGHRINPGKPQIEEFNDFDKQYVVFLVRGVDPHSTKQKNRYDISKLLGYNSWGVKYVEFSAKLNIPIQKNTKNVKHDIATNNTLDPYSNTYLFHNSFSFLPDVTQMKSFKTDLPQYYSSLSNVVANWNNNGHYTQKFFCTGDYCPHIDSSYPNNSTYQYKPNYYVNENLEGGSSLYFNLYYYMVPAHTKAFGIDFNCTKNCTYNKSYCSSDYTLKKYTNQIKIEKSTSWSNNRIVMRGDRQPTSTADYKPNPGVDSFRALHANPIFSVYVLEDEGGVNTSVPPNSVPTNGEGEITNKLLETFVCEKLVPLECYIQKQVNGKNQLDTQPIGDKCYTNGIGGSLAPIMENGCYVLVTVPFLSIATDFYLISEWNSRFILNYAACQNVFGHVFTNNWVNGSLFAFSFINQRVFDKKNNPNAVYCSDVVYLDTREVTLPDDTKKTSYSYYYRSSPYNSGKFVGELSPTGVSRSNTKNLNFPTTIMDLGPRDLFTQQVIESDEYDGYVLDTLSNTTYQDTSSIISLFLVSRLTSKGFLNSVGSATLSFYFSRKNSFIDGDVAQLISINSEYGVYPYTSAFYGDSASFINNLVGETVVGIYFTGKTQNRDYITPKRNIYYNSGSLTDNCGLSDIPVKTQTVPFYQWNIRDADETSDQSIFGSQLNNWSTNPDSPYFFQYDYQKMDRLLGSSRYFRTNKSVYTKDFQGFIYSVDGQTRELLSNVNTWQRNTTPNEDVVTGAPFFFYFGLKKGKTSFDKFTQVWLDIDRVE